MNSVNATILSETRIENNQANMANHNRLAMANNSNRNQKQSFKLRDFVIFCLSLMCAIIVIGAIVQVIMAHSQRHVLDQTQISLRDTYSNAFAIYKDAIEVQSKVQDIFYVANSNSLEGGGIKLNINSSLNIINDDLKKIAQNNDRLMTQSLIELTKELSTNINDFAEQAKSIAVFRSSNNQTMVPDSMLEPFTESYQTIIGNTSALANTANELLTSARGLVDSNLLKAQTMSQKNQVINYGSYTIILLIIVLLSAVIIHWVVRPISQVTIEIDRVANGDLSQLPPQKTLFREIFMIRKSLTGLIGTSKLVDSLSIQQQQQQQKLERQQQIEAIIHRFNQSVTKIVSAIQNGSKDVEISAESMLKDAGYTNQIVQSASSSTEESKNQLSSVANSTSELNASIGDIVTQIKRATDLSDNATTATKHADDTMINLQNAVQKIGDVVKFIREIAEQTNLLALNATIESARVGVAGQGFAVVAREVKQLSAQTTEATGHIAAYIEGVEHATHEALAAVSSLRDMIIEVNAVSTHVASSVTQQKNATGLIAENIEFVSTRASDMSKTMQEVSINSDRSAQTAMTLFKSSRELSDEANQLQIDVKAFFNEILNA